MLRPLLLAILSLSALGAAAPASAEQMTMYLYNRAPHPVAVEFSAPEGGGVWPGGGQVYLLEKGERKSVRIECRGGERVCYGAWRYGDDRTAFGVGPDRDLACEDCCHVCTPGLEPRSSATIMIGR